MLPVSPPGLFLLWARSGGPRVFCGEAGSGPRRDSSWTNPWPFCPQLRFRFGDVFSLQLAWKPVIVVNGLAAVREALVNHSEDTSDRPWMPIYEHLGLGPRSQGNLQQWQEWKTGGGRGR